MGNRGMYHQDPPRRPDNLTDTVNVVDDFGEDRLVPVPRL